jgi:sugar phosphate isomerase/epimerase
VRIGDGQGLGVWHARLGMFFSSSVLPRTAMVECRDMIEFSISTSLIRGDLAQLESLIRLSGFRKLEIGFYDEESLPSVMSFATGRGLSYGFHDPLPRLPSDDFPFLTDPDEEKRWRTLDSMHRTMETAVAYGAEYVVGHIPSVIWEPQPALSDNKIVELAHRSCDQLSKWSRESNIPFALENVGPNPYFFHFEAFVDVMRAFPDLEFCLDIGHLHLMSVYAGLDSLQFASAMAPHTHDRPHLQRHAGDVSKAPPRASPSFAAAAGWLGRCRLHPGVRTEGSEGRSHPGLRVLSAVPGK